MPSQLILCSVPNQETADKIAHLLIGQQLAACVNILPAIQSVYQWQGKIESANELLLIIKSEQHRYKAIETLIVNQHPYEIPEIIAVSIERGLPSYLQWIHSCSPSD